MGELRPHVAVGEPGSGSRECGSSVRIRLLGGFSVAVAGTPVSDPWRLRKARTLVKLLALAPGHRQPRDQVTEVLWPGASRRAGINNFHQVVHAVRRVIGPDAIALDDTVVRLNSPDVVTVDIDDFERAADDRTADLDVTLRAARLRTGQLLPEDLYAD